MYVTQSPALFKGYQNLILDIDGTLAEWPKMFFNYCKKAFEKELKTKFLYETAEAFNVGVAKNFVELLIEHGQDEKHADLLWKHFAAHYRRYARLYPWVHQFLNDCARKYQLAVCTNNDEKLARGVMGDHDILIPEFHCRSASQYHKPELEFYRELWTRKGIDLRNSIYVTDEFLDAFRAKLAGVAEVILVTWGHSSDDDIRAAKKVGIKVVDSVEALYALLELQK